jgi:hypothetical protein
VDDARKSGRRRCGRAGGGKLGKRIVFVVVLFRRFLINDGYFEKDQMKKFERSI